MDNDTARKIEALRELLKEFPEATLCIDSEAALMIPNVSVKK